MENCDLVVIKEEPVFEDFFTITEVSEDEDSPLNEPVIPVSEQNYSVKCEICNKGFLPKELQIHLATAHITTTTCFKCNESFPSNWYLSRHDATMCNAIYKSNQTNEEIKMECKSCSKKFISIWDFKLHATACRFKPTKKNNKIEKVRRKKSKSSFVCLVCDKEFTNKVSYVRHKHSNSFRSTCRTDTD